MSSIPFGEIERDLFDALPGEDANDDAEVEIPAPRQTMPARPIGLDDVDDEEPATLRLMA